MEKLEKWLDKNDMNPDVSIGDVMSYDIDDEEVIIGGFDSEDFIDIDNLIKSLGYERSCDMATFCVLHELGHYNTIDYLSEEAIKNYSDYRFFYPILNSNIVPYFIRKKLKDYIAYRYHRQDMELAATLWACHFMQDNEKEVKKLSKILKSMEVR